MNSGVYIIENKKNGHRYVGSSVKLAGRQRDHFHQLRRGKHANAHLQSAWSKYGESAFEFDVLEYWEPEFLVSMEQWWMNVLQPEYNIQPVAYSRIGNTNALGLQHTPEARAKISAAHMGNTYNIGRKATAEACANMSRAGKGKPWSPAQKAAHKGKTHSEATRTKISAAMMGHKVSDETKAKISTTLKGKTKGKPWSSARRAAYEASKGGEI